jgi:hypothetical protein
MKKTLGVAVLAVGAALLPVAAFCQTQAPATETQAESQVRVVAPEDQPSKEQLARLFEVMQLKQQMASMMKTLPAMLQQQVSQQLKSTLANLPGGSSLTPDQQAAFDKLMKEYMEKALSLYPADEMISDLSGIYQKHLSKEDVEAMIAFYTSPAGHHLLELTPAVMKEYMPLVMSRTQERSKALTEQMMKDLKEIVPNLPSDTTSH